MMQYGSLTEWHYVEASESFDSNVAISKLDRLHYMKATFGERSDSYLAICQLESLSLYDRHC